MHVTVTQQTFFKAMKTIVLHTILIGVYNLLTGSFLGYVYNTNTTLSIICSVTL